MPGTPWHRPDRIKYYLTCIEWDKQLGFDELFGGTSLREVCKKHFIEQHLDDTTKGHLWVYSPIVFPKKSADTVIGIEVKGLGSHGVIISTPCIHKNGYRIESIGLSEPVTWNREEAFRMLLHVVKICKKHNVPYLDRDGNGNASPLSSNVKKMIKSLTIDPSVEIQHGHRHDIMISIANSILFQHSTTKSHDKLRDFFIQINDSLCKPDSLPETEVLRLWEDALDFVSKIKELGQQQREKSSDVVRGEDMVWIPSEVRQELAESY